MNRNHNAAEYIGGFNEYYAYNNELKEFIGHEEYFRAIKKTPPLKHHLEEVTQFTIMKFINERKK